jgi:hypothetical protein
MTIGILNHKARDREHAWRTLGFVPSYTKEDTSATKMFAKSGHVGSKEMNGEKNEEKSEDKKEDQEMDGAAEVNKAADYHAILEALLASLKQLIEEGMVVDVRYKDQLYKNCELVFFVPFIKCDGDEGDKLCLHYRSRGQHIQQLCRYCKCPNKDTDNQMANYGYKEEPMLRKLFENNRAEKLKELSQIGVQNAFHGLRFGLHNKRGIHGACPVEMLHAILLGIFMYTRDSFFQQMGATSTTAKRVNELSRKVGALLSRQSDRNKPRTKFSRGIHKGKLMAKEYTGVLLVMTAVLQCETAADPF